ncbi:hypothetical protein [Methylomonas rivi]|uniref:Uncharacterized protein n=1 Tax=Methylomonas rivi TaxID=2952226 RepID=A0ABT1U595_9GAMM|nr:hypothetical protein [Methylomonas sp. WSC-6]MCQ8128271.1 hypothetical protein [Methylomonas sp. WSC-6]
MSIRPALLIHVALLSGGLLSACATSRQIAVDYPKTETSPLSPIKGQSSVTADDYYVQIVSEFEFKGDNALKGGCSDIGASYESGDLSAALLFNIHNDALKLKRETSGFLYQATTGKCNFKLETKKVNLTPWLRLDSAKDTQVEYSFLTSNNHEANLSQLVGDINAASGLMALTGVGTGIAVMGKLAGSWVEASAAQPAVNKPSAAAKYSSETHNLPASVTLGSQGGQLNQSRLTVYEVVDGGMKAWASETKLLGEMRVYPELLPSLLLKSIVEGVPDAHDLSLDELLRLPIQTAAGEMPLRQLIDQVDQAEKPNLNPDWQQYDEVENQCRRLKLVLKGLGFNKYDRNAVLYYFLAKSADWKNFNITPQKAMADAIRPRVLEQYRSKDFAGCLATEDYVAMQSMRLPVNTVQDWDNLSSNRQKKEGVISSVQSVGRQLLTALSHPDKEEVARQLYPLLTADNGGNGSVLLQNHLGNFGLEALLQLPAIPDEGVVISAAQFAAVIAGLNVDSFSCVRPAMNQGQPLANIGITLFVGKPGSPREKGGALEFEVVRDKITRLAFQHSSYRDFEQNITDYPDLGGCRIEAEFLKQLH